MIFLKQLIRRAPGKQELTSRIFVRPIALEKDGTTKKKIGGARANLRLPGKM